MKTEKVIRNKTTLSLFSVLATAPKDGVVHSLNGELIDPSRTGTEQDRHILGDSGPATDESGASHD